MRSSSPLTSRSIPRHWVLAPRSVFSTQSGSNPSTGISRGCAPSGTPQQLTGVPGNPARVMERTLPPATHFLFRNHPPPPPPPTCSGPNTCLIPQMLLPHPGPWCRRAKETDELKPGSGTHTPPSRIHTIKVSPTTFAHLGAATVLSGRVTAVNPLEQG